MIELSRKTSVEWLKEQDSKIPPIPDMFEGRGIVFVAGGDKYWTNAYASIRLLRDKGCELPIRCYYLGEKEKNQIIQDALAEYDVECMDLISINNSLPEEQKHTHLCGWEAKAFAILHSPFKDVWFSDADVFYDGDGEWQFESEEYKTFGAIFCPDFNRLQEDRDIWTLTGVEYRDEPEIESGVIFVDKERCWRPLNLTSKMCEYGTRFGWFGSHGDKCLFQMGWHYYQQDYYMIPQPIHRVPGTMCQHNLKGRRWAYHRNMRKFNLLENETIKSFANEEALHQYVEELRSIYNPFKLDDEDVETRLLAGSSFTYHRVGIDKRKMVFGKNNTIISGRAKLETSYSVKDKKLHILDDVGKTTAILERFDNDKSWVGRWIVHERCLVILEGE